MQPVNIVLMFGESAQSVEGAKKRLWSLLDAAAWTGIGLVLMLPLPIRRSQSNSKKKRC